MQHLGFYKLVIVEKQMYQQVALETLLNHTSWKMSSKFEKDGATCCTTRETINFFDVKGICRQTHIHLSIEGEDSMLNQQN